MKIKIKFLLIGLSSIFLAYISFYTIPEIIIITNIFIFIGAASVIIGNSISPDKKSDETKDDN